MQNKFLAVSLYNFRAQKKQIIRMFIKQAVKQKSMIFEEKMFQSDSCKNYVHAQYNFN